jgi:hypothetical protein
LEIPTPIRASNLGTGNRLDYDREILDLDRRHRERTKRPPTSATSPAPQNQVDGSGSIDIVSMAASGAMSPDALVCALMPVAKLAPTTAR